MLNNRLGCYLGDVPLCDRILGDTTLGQTSLLILIIINQLNLHEGSLKNILVKNATGDLFGFVACLGLGT